MVFPGRFSTGCKRCRQRKVKCDEGRPSCRRCQIYGQPCPGYADQFHFRFDKTASKQENPSPPPRRRVRPQPPSQQQPPPPNHNRNQTLVRATGGTRPLAIMPQLELSYDDISLCYFVRRFVTADESDNLPGHLSFLPSLYNHSGHGLLELATLSVAQMAAYNQFGGEKFRLQSYQNYGRAVRTLRKTIEDENEVTDDRVLAAVLLLCAFKDIGEAGWGDPSEHASGLYYLLERRGVEQFCTQRGFELFLLSLLKLQVHAFLHQDNKYSDPGGLVAWLSTVNPMMRAMALMTQTIQLRQSLLECSINTNRYHNATEYSSSSSGSQGYSDEADQSTLSACFQALEEFDTWDIEAESYWRDTFNGRSIPAALGDPARGVAYYDPKTACIIILVRSARMILLLSILEYYDAIRVSCSGEDGWRVGNQAAWVSCIPILEENLRLAIDDMLYCVPFAMGDRGPDGGPVTGSQDGAAALVVFQPVKLVTFCVYATPEQRKCSQDILDRMNTTIGVRSAMSWEKQAPLIASAPPQQPGTQGLIRAMALLTNSGAVASC
ncbi:putative transcriptional regulatory protein [Rosellinia necatrix]|uniref:Putative transcriptional regulatory protein n=1 Tax=Rosellinia necatrix TaxID=77044 RepID=A0A1W2TGF6_ROSNE|nr:putative transcriptional regulatory protein [Rosellinia necatrix]